MAAYIGVITLLAQGASSVRSAGAQRTAGRITELETETAAQKEELGAVQREADRKAKLSRALSSQIASSGAKGISAFEGSPLTILQADIEAEETATERDAFNTRLTALTMRTRGQAAKTISKAESGLTLLSGGARTGYQASQLAGTFKGGE